MEAYLPIEKVSAMTVIPHEGEWALKKQKIDFMNRMDIGNINNAHLSSEKHTKIITHRQESCQ